MSAPNVHAPETLSAPALDGALVDLSSTDWTPAAGKGFARRLWVGGAGAGALKVDFVGVDGSGGATGIAFAGVPVGLMEICVTKIYKTGTDVTSIVAFY